MKSASYMENSIDSNEDTISDEKAIHENLDEEYTPKLFYRRKKVKKTLRERLR